MTMASDGDDIHFGRTILKSHFPHIASSGTTLLNSGSFGISPNTVIERKIQFVKDFEAYGDFFIRKRLLASFASSVQAVAELLGLQASHCTLVDNVTTGISNLIERFALPDEVILVNTWTYGAVASAAKLVGAAKPETRRVIEVGIQLPLASAEEFVEQVRVNLEAHPEIKIAIFDHITSATACVMPVKQLVDLCHQRDILVIIDGAHAIGQIPDLDIADIGADFYVGNLHKWLFVPKSAALLWAKTDELIEKLRPSVVSWLVSDPEMSVRYAFLGTRDISSFCAVTAAVDFVRNVCGGVRRIHAYCSQLADEATQHLVELWSSHRLPIPANMEAPYMRLIALPKHLQHPEVLQLTKENKMSSRMWEFLLNKVDLNVLLLSLGGVLYIRVSFAVIVCMDDIRKLGETMMRLSKDDFMG